MQKRTFSIQVREPFSFHHTLAFVGGFSPMAGEQAVLGLRLRKAHEIGGRAVLVDVASSGRAMLEVTLHAETELTASDEAFARDRVAFMLSLDDDLAPFYDLAERDPAFAPVVRAQLGHHHVKFPSAFEIAVWAVLAQRTPMPLARKVKWTLVERLGTSIVVDGERHAAFPTAERLAAASEGELGRAVKHPIKAAGIAAIARAFARVDEDWLRRGPFADVQAWLSALPRIGAWSTAFILFR